MPRFLFASDSLKGTLSSAQTAELLAAAAGLPLVAPAERDVTIDRSHADARLGRTSFTVMCDVDNPLLGPNGATRTFAPQKGADAARVERLERGMANYCRVLRRTARSRPASPPRAPGRACRAWPSWAPWSPAPCPRRASRRSSPPRAVP